MHMPRKSITNTLNLCVLFYKHEASYQETLRLMLYFYMIFLEIDKQD